MTWVDKYEEEIRMIEITSIEALEMMMIGRNYGYAHRCDKQALEVYLQKNAIFVDTTDGEDVLLLMNSARKVIAFLEKDVNHLEPNEYNLSGFMYTIEEVRAKFEQSCTLVEPERTDQLRLLMEILERQFGTMQINPSEEFMEKEEVQLYREISRARNI